MFLMATINWTANIACLALAIDAVRSPVPWSGLILAWTVGMGAGSFGITPGVSASWRRPWRERSSPLASTPPRR